ncbi:MAG: Spo0B domain-containing protein [Firmicutes bacterium]|nr:Spo0B domain-containing protein [Bacillota bacterium]
MVEAGRCLRVLRSQQHDFLNHLQVLSGLAQLGRTEELRAYISEVVREIGSVRRVTRLKMPSLALALLALRTEAALREIAVELDVATDLEGCRVPEGVLVRLADGLLEVAGLTRLDLTFAETASGSRWEVRCHGPGDEEMGRVARGAQELLRPWGATAVFRGHGVMEISL